MISQGLVKMKKVIKEGGIQPDWCWWNKKASIC
jgi:hypothetical protein